MPWRWKIGNVSEEPTVSIFRAAAILLHCSWRHVTFSLQKLKQVRFKWVHVNVDSCNGPLLLLLYFNKLESIQITVENLCYNRFTQPNPFLIMNQCWIICILNRFTPGDKILTLYFLLTFSRTKLTVARLWILWTLLVSVYPLSKLKNFPPLPSVTSQDLALQQGASRLQTTSASLDVFNKYNITLEDIKYFPLLNPTEWRHHRITCIILLSTIKF
jgi:hypothetical protein